MGMRSPWQKLLEKKAANIGFMSRLGAFRDPTPSEKASALAIEINSWQATKGTRPYSISAEYKTPLGHGFNLKANRQFQEPLKGPKRIDAIEAYIETPMDAGVIDITPYIQHSIWFKFKRWIKKKIIGRVFKKLSYMELQEYFKENK